MDQVIQELCNSSEQAKSLDLPKLRQECSHLESLEDQMHQLVEYFPDICNFDPNEVRQLQSELHSLQKQLTQLENQSHSHENKRQKLDLKKKDTLTRFEAKKQQIIDLKRQKYKIESK